MSTQRGNGRIGGKPVVCLNSIDDSAQDAECGQTEDGEQDCAQPLY